jgi:hypothetical protein
LLGLAMIALTSCSTGSKTTAAPSFISVTASNYKFVAPASVPAGAISVTLTNAGTEAHQAQLFHMNDGVDAGKLVAAGRAQSPDLALDELGAWVGGPNAVGPGGTNVATTKLPPGKYAFICLVPNAKGQSHLSLGMVSLITVTANSAEASLPAAGYNASTREFGFQPPAKWTGTIAVTNTGRQPHELQILGVAPGKTPADVEKSFKSQSGTAGPPPWTAEGGVATIAPGTRGVFTANLESGTYYMMCFVTDPQRKAPHFALGMMTKFAVK